MLESLVGEETGPVLPRLRRAFVVGDLLRRSEVARLQRIAPSLACINLYGLTESQRAFGFTTVARPDEGPRGKEAIPLGRGIPGVELLVMSASGSVAGVGELGEVYMRSRHLARGYLGDAELTQQRFLVNPFRPAGEEVDPEDRVYRTGDVGRYRADGEVESPAVPTST
jgi:non-ribosomal peptide synthetase component F